MTGRCSLDEMQNYLPPVRTCPVFKQIDALPGSQQGFSGGHRNSDGRLRECSLDVGGQIVVPLRAMV